MSKTNSNWQPISQLDIFASLVEKMMYDTQTKLNKLKQIRDDQCTVTDAELVSILHILHRQVGNYPFMVEQFQRWRAQNPTSSELQLIETALAHNEVASAFTNECQTIANGLVRQTIEAKSNVAGNISNSITTVNLAKYHSKKSYSLTDEQLSSYKRFRTILQDLHPKFIVSIPKDGFTRCGKRLEVLQGNSLFLNTEHETNLLFDYCLHTYKESGRNCLQQSFNRFSAHYEGETLKVFKVAKEGYFAYLESIKPIADGGLVVYDRLRNREHLMIDSGLNKVAKSMYKHTVVTFVMDFGEYVITTGASTPVAVHTEEGIKVQRRFNEYLALVASGKNTTQDDAQYITDMYKICLHEGITGKVDSLAVPFGKEALQKRVRSSSNVH